MRFTYKGVEYDRSVNTASAVKTLMDEGLFHHATERANGTLMDGWHIYAKDDNKFNGFMHVGSIFKGSADYAAIYGLDRNTGYSVGCYGGG